jgi:hypothetical protein
MNVRKSLPALGECSSTPRGLFRHSLQRPPPRPLAVQKTPVNSNNVSPAVVPSPTPKPPPTVTPTRDDDDEFESEDFLNELKELEEKSLRKPTEPPAELESVPNGVHGDGSPVLRKRSPRLANKRKFNSGESDGDRQGSLKKTCLEFNSQESKSQEVGAVDEPEEPADGEKSLQEGDKSCQSRWK